MKKCELALNVAFTWTENVKVAETKLVLALPSPAPSHIICTLWKRLSLWVVYLLATFTATVCRAPGELLPFQRGQMLKYTSSAQILHDYRLNHCQTGRKFSVEEAFNSNNHFLALNKEHRSSVGS